MLWLIIKNASHQIMSCNIHEDEDKNKNPLFQLWITRPNGKNLKIKESNNRNIIEEIKEAIDYAIEHKETALRLV